MKGDEYYFMPQRDIRGQLFCVFWELKVKLKWFDMIMLLQFKYNFLPALASKFSTFFRSQGRKQQGGLCPEFKCKKRLFMVSLHVTPLHFGISTDLTIHRIHRCHFLIGESYCRRFDIHRGVLFVLWTLKNQNFSVFLSVLVGGFKSLQVFLQCFAST